MRSCLLKPSFKRRLSRLKTSYTVLTIAVFMLAAQLHAQNTRPNVILIICDDLKRSGMLDHTLVVWATEFGRMPFLQANGTGRDHSPGAFTCFLAGAGVKKGFSYGESDVLA